MKTFISILILAILSISSWAIHPTHMSVINIEFKAESLEISYDIRIPQDDINQLFTSLYHEELFHSSDTIDFIINSDKIDSYFIERFKLTTDNVSHNPVLIKKDNQQSSHCRYYVVKLQKVPERIQIENKILLDLYSNQTNLVIFSQNNDEKGLTFDINTQSQYIYLDKK